MRTKNETRVVKIKTNTTIDGGVKRGVKKGFAYARFPDMILLSRGGKARYTLYKLQDGYKIIWKPGNLEVVGETEAATKRALFAKLRELWQNRASIDPEMRKDIEDRIKEVPRDTNILLLW